MSPPQAAAHAEAIAAERAAETDLLIQMLEVAKPALRACSSRIKSVDAHTGGRNGTHPVSLTEWLPGRYVTLINEEGEPADSTGNEGSYEGVRLVVDADGNLHEIRSTGAWSRWQGAWSRRERTIRSVTAAEAMGTYDLEDVLRSLYEALAAQAAGDKTAATEAALKRVTQLHAICKLVQK